MRKSKCLIFFSCELPLILGVGGKLKNPARDIYKRTLDIEFERDRSICLGSTIGDGQTDTHIHTFLDCGSDVESKFIKNLSRIFLRLHYFLHS